MRKTRVKALKAAAFMLGHKQQKSLNRKAKRVYKAKRAGRQHNTSTPDGWTGLRDIRSTTAGFSMATWTQSRRRDGARLLAIPRRKAAAARDAYENNKGAPMFLRRLGL